MKLLVQFFAVMVAATGTVFFTQKSEREKSDVSSTKQDSLVLFAGGGKARNSSQNPTTSRAPLRKIHLQVVHHVLPGNQASAALSNLLREFERENTYGDQVVFREVVIESGSDIVAQYGLDLDDFRGLLTFHSKNARFEPLRDTTDKQLVHHRIEACLSGLTDRFADDWLPEVRGMQRR